MRQLRESLFQGDISDLNLLKDDDARRRLGFGLAINVGSTNFIPPNMPAIHFPMIDGDGNDWDAIWGIVRLVEHVILFGKKKTLVTCDAGISRSIVFCAMVIAALDYRPMDEDLRDEISMPDPPLHNLWEEAGKTVRRYMSV